jgi:hypothetical protein
MGLICGIGKHAALHINHHQRLHFFSSVVAKPARSGEEVFARFF